MRPVTAPGRESRSSPMLDPTPVVSSSTTTSPCASRWSFCPRAGLAAGALCVRKRLPRAPRDPAPSCLVLDVNLPDLSGSTCRSVFPTIGSICRSSSSRDTATSDDGQGR